MSRTIELIAGLLLLVVGILVLASEPLLDFVRSLGIGDDVLHWWPVLVIGLSLFFSFLGVHRYRELAAACRDGDPRRDPGRHGAALLYQPHGPMERLGIPVDGPPLQLRVGDVRGGMDRRCARVQVDRLRDRPRGVVAYLVFATAFGGEAFRVVAALGILALAWR